MALTITIPGAVETTTGSTAPAVLTVGVGSPGVGVPSGGSTGQYLVKASATSYDTAWLTLPANYITSVTAPLAVTAGNLAVDLSAYLTTATAASTYQTIAGMSSYLTSATAASTYAVIAAGQPTSGTVGQVLTKNSGTNYDSSWATLIPGDRYLTSSTTSNTINNGTKSFTIGTGLSYTPTQSITISYNAANHMHGEVLTYNSGTGALSVDINHHTGSGTYAAWTVNVAGVVPVASIVWGDITGTLGNQTDLATALNNKLETSTAATTYAALAGATFTGEVSTPASTTGTAGFSILPGTAPTSPINGEFWNTGTDLQVRLGGVTETLAEQSWVTSQGYLTSSALTPYAPLAGATFTGLVTTLASATGTAGLNVPHGVAPTSPVNGDIWTTTGAVFARINASTKQLMTLSDTQTVSGSITFSNASQTLGSSTATGTINVASGATISASTKTLNIGTGGVSGSTTTTTVGPVLGASTTTIGGTTAASTLNLATGATLTGTTKAVNIGTAGVSGSTTNIAIGGTAGTSTTTLNGTTNGVTAAVDTNTVALATTAYVVGQGYAKLASPTFTGTPTLPTGTIATTQSPGNNTTALATTAFVTAAVPLVATFAESQQLTSATAFMSPFDTLMAMMTEGYRPALGMTGGSTGAGAGVNAIMPQYMGIGGPNTLTAGNCYAITNVNGSYSTASTSIQTIKWNKPVCISGTFNAVTALTGEANNEFKIFLGASMLNGDDPTSASIGLFKLGGTTPISVMVHNGTTLTKVASSSSFGGTTPIRYLVYSDGNGNVTLYINGTSVATTALGPTGATQTNVGQFTASIKQTATAVTRYYIELVHPKIFVAPQ